MSYHFLNLANWCWFFTRTIFYIIWWRNINFIENKNILILPMNIMHPTNQNNITSFVFSRKGKHLLKKRYQMKSLQLLVSSPKRISGQWWVSYRNIEASHLFWSAKQMICFYMKDNIRLKWNNCKEKGFSLTQQNRERLKTNWNEVT